MNILVIGNGFDLAHNLKTSYVDFVDFYNIIRTISSTRYKESRINENSAANVRENFTVFKTVVEERFSLKTYNKLVGFFSLTSVDIGVDIIEKSKNNFWLQYVDNQDKVKNPKWCFFEEIITKYLELLAWIEKNPNVLQGVLTVYKYDSNRLLIDEMIKEIQDFNSKKFKKYIGNNEQLNYFEVIAAYREQLLKQLDELIFLLDVYLTIFLNDVNLNAPITYFFRNLHVNKIVNFNYTSTYWSYYQKVNGDSIAFNESNIHFIHGKANFMNSLNVDYFKKLKRNKNHVKYRGSIRKYKNNMVLGVGSEIRNTDDDSIINYTGFQKYFQRIIKKTGVDYIDWLKLTEQSTENNIIIYGHSLDIPDGDVIKAIVDEPVNIYIFYYDEKALVSITTNLVKIFGQDEVIRLTNSSKIIFLSCQIQKEEAAQLAEILNISYQICY